MKKMVSGDKRREIVCYLVAVVVVAVVPAAAVVAAAVVVAPLAAAVAFEALAAAAASDVVAVVGDVVASFDGAAPSGIGGDGSFDDLVDFVEVDCVADPFGGVAGEDLDVEQGAIDAFEADDEYQPRTQMSPAGEACPESRSLAVDG